MAEPLVLSASEAQALAFRASFGDAASTNSAGSIGQAPVPGQSDTSGLSAAISSAAAALERLGYVQIDTISVVERAHHHVLWSRDWNYRPSVLPALEAEPRRAFEYWAHAAAYLPMSDYRYCLPRMKRIAADGHDWFASDRRMEEWVLDRIRAEGPLRSQDFESNGARGPWWDWKPAKAALEYLFQSGELMVVARPGFQKLYDLAEKVLPPGTDTSFPTEAEMGDWYVRRTALALGVFTLRDLAYQRKDGIAGIAGALDRACEVGSLHSCVVQATAGDKRTAVATTARTAGGGGTAVKSWCASGLLSLYAGSRQVVAGDDDARPVRILSPFDNLIIDRKRASRIFGLEYTIECYVPAAKRRFGYFALPVFYRGTPVGLIDCKADRKNGLLLVKRAGFDWGLEPAGGPDGFAEAFASELGSFADFNSCSVSH